LIGVISRPDQVGVVEEFFELFKTPWEPYRPGCAYDVVLVTTDVVPEVQPKLLLVYGTDTKQVDESLGIRVCALRKQAILSDRDAVLPIYGDVLTFAEGNEGVVCLTAGSESAGLRLTRSYATVMRLGYDLFDEVEFLLSVGQPSENAHIPTLDIHIMMLREWILRAGLNLLEIPPVPTGYSFSVCLTHDIDFVGIRNHKFDHTMWGFLYRATIGSVGKYIRGRLSLRKLLKNWQAAVSLPMVYFGWARDFWDPFDWYLEVEKNLPATYFFIPFKGRAGENVPGRNVSRRAAAYDITYVRSWTATLLKQGCELGVHGIDSWHSSEKGRDELARITAVTGSCNVGIRMHWLIRNENTFRTLEEAGYSYDSSAGYNETIGYRNGTTQAFCPTGVQAILELPLHIQDGALFYPQRLDLSESEAEKRCQTLIENTSKFGGVLTLLWHDRSHGPERFWGDFYVTLVQRLRSLDGWFGTAGHIVDWFRKRRAVRFERDETAVGSAQAWLRYVGQPIVPPLTLRVYRGSYAQDMSATASQRTAGFVDIPFNGEADHQFDRLNQILFDDSLHSVRA